MHHLPSVQFFTDVAPFPENPLKGGHSVHLMLCFVLLLYVCLGQSSQRPIFMYEPAPHCLFVTENEIINQGHLEWTKLDYHAL